VILGSFVGIAFWLKKAIESSSSRELAAQVPLHLKSIEELKSKNKELENRVELLKNQLAQKDIELAKKEKDIYSLSEAEQKSRYELERLVDRYEELREQKVRIEHQNERLKGEVEAKEENLQRLKIDLEEQGKRLELKLNEIMQKSLEEKIKKFDESSIKSLEAFMKPFKENIESFKKKVEENQEFGLKKFTELSKEIEQVMKAGLNITKEAENLTQALKGKKQAQGSWGEMILDSVLEYSGLIKGRHYEMQESYRDEDGNTKRPDVVVKLPKDKIIIIDSKVSLVDYDEYIRSENDESRNLAAKKVSLAFRNHIDTLHSKEYGRYSPGTLQYIFMFVPIEGAFALAVQQDQGLYEYALRKNIAIVNPTTLTVSLRTIYLYWQNEQANTKILKIFEEAGKMYDKMGIFVESFQKIGGTIQTLNSHFENAEKQLSQGKGNLLGRVENIKLLGAKTSKNIKESVAFDPIELDEVEVELLEEQGEEGA